jgi:flagellar motor switch protein FliG
MPLSGREKATIFLSILGADVSTRILRYLPNELAQLIVSGLNRLPSPSPEALTEVLNEFSNFVALPEPKKEEAVRQIEEKPAPPPQPKRSYGVLMYERPQMVAFLLSLLPEDARKEALQSFPREKSTVADLLEALKKNPLTDKIGDKLRELFRNKIFIP